VRNGDSGQADGLDLSTGLKYELDALANKDFQYLTKTCPPTKPKEKDGLD
jgi:DNA topoisomerase-6 subunit A